MFKHCTYRDAALSNHNRSDFPRAFSGKRTHSTFTILGTIMSQENREMVQLR